MDVAQTLFKPFPNHIPLTGSQKVSVDLILASHISLCLASGVEVLVWMDCSPFCSETTGLNSTMQNSWWEIHKNASKDSKHPRQTKCWYYPLAKKKKKNHSNVITRESVKIVLSVHRAYKHPSWRSSLWFPFTVTKAPGKNKEVLEHTFLGSYCPGS